MYMEVMKGKTLHGQVTKGLAARLSGLHSVDSRESLRCQSRALASQKLCYRKFTLTAASRPKIKSDMVA